MRAAQQQLIQRERLAAIGEFSAKIVHEVRSPLSTMMMALDHLHQLELPQTSKRRLTLAQEEAGRLNRLLGEILSYATPGAGRRSGWMSTHSYSRLLLHSTMPQTDASVRSGSAADATSDGRAYSQSDKLPAADQSVEQCLRRLPVGTEVTIELARWTLRA